MNVSYNIISHEDKVFKLIRSIKDFHFKDKEKKIREDWINIWKEGLGATHIIYNNEYFLFVKEISETEYEEIS